MVVVFSRLSKKKENKGNERFNLTIYVMKAFIVFMSTTRKLIYGNNVLLMTDDQEAVIPHIP